MPKPSGRRPRRTSSERRKPPVRPLDTSDVVLTPGGARPRSLVHTLQPGEHVSLKDGYVRIIETATGEVVKDLGEVAAHADGEDAAEATDNDRPVPGLSDKIWIEDAYWRNGGPDPIISFTTSWIVPPVPASDDGQTIFLFNGMEPDSAPHILQPVLQWGASFEGGGNYWSITNWYASGPGGPATARSPIQVSPGTVLQGVITCTGQSSSGYNYTCQFIGYPDVDVTVKDAPELTWAFETLEAYGTSAGVNAQGVAQVNPLTQCSDYPATPMTAMHDIGIRTGKPGSSGTDAAIDWVPVTNFTDCGQSCVIVSSGEVDLYYQPRTLPPEGKYNIQTSGGYFLTAVDGGGLGGPNNTGVALHSDARERSTWETFQLILVQEGSWYALQTSSGHNYVTAVNGGGVGGPNNSKCPFHTDLRSNERPGTWETFTLVYVDEPAGKVALRTENGNYVTAVNGGGTGGPNTTPIHTDAVRVSDWEKWHLVLL